jgi:hypothetical protein
VRTLAGKSQNSAAVDLEMLEYRVRSAKFIRNDGRLPLTSAPELRRRQFSHTKGCLGASQCTEISREAKPIIKQL